MRATLGATETLAKQPTGTCLPGRCRRRRSAAGHGGRTVMASLRAEGGCQAGRSRRDGKRGSGAVRRRRTGHRRRYSRTWRCAGGHGGGGPHLALIWVQGRAAAMASPCIVLARPVPVRSLELGAWLVSRPVCGFVSRVFRLRSAGRFSVDRIMWVVLLFHPREDKDLLVVCPP